MVDESGSIASHGGINHHVIVHLEHVAANPLLVVVPLPVVSQYGPDLFPCILNNLKLSEFSTDQQDEDALKSSSWKHYN